MTANSARISAIRITLVLMALLLIVTPQTFARAALTADATEAADSSSGEAPATDADAAATDAAATDAAATDTAEAAVEEPVEEPAPPALEESTKTVADEPDDVEESALPETAGDADAAGQSANGSGPYDSTTDGSPSGNGNGDNGNKPCAGCVGNADDKNPPGQLPGADEDGDQGYECDGNSGVGKTNPAHSGCKDDAPDPDPSITLVKTGPAEAEVGERITYTFDVTNNGDAALDNVYITDSLIGGGNITVSGGDLAVGESAQATAQYTVDADDVRPDNTVHNTATVSGTDPQGTTVTATDSWVVKVPPVIVIPKMHTICHATGQPTKYVVLTADTDGIFNGHLGAQHQGGRDIIPPFVYDRDGKTYSQNWDAAGQAIFNAGCKIPELPAEIDLEKSGPDFADPGEVITYRFDVTNTGDVDLADVHVTDPLLGDVEFTVTPSTLEANGGEGVATAQYTIPEDAEPGDTIPNTATATGTPVNGADDVSATDDHLVQIRPQGPRPEIALVKGGPETADVGDVITYSFNVTNTGNTTLSNVHVTDPLLGGTAIAVDPPTLMVGESGVAEAQYTVDADDVQQRGPAVEPIRFVPNTATARGTSPQGVDVLATDDHEVLLPNDPDVDRPNIRLEKDGPASARVGDRITYTFTVTNTGDVTLTNVRIDDPLISSRSLAVRPSTLAPGAVGTARATYTITVRDGEAGEVLNTAIVRGQPPRGPEIEDEDDHEVDVPDVPGVDEPDIELIKTGPATATVGDTITYRFRATNTGETTLTNVHITDEKLGIDNLAVTPSTLAPGQSGTASATYTITDADGEAGFVFNTAVVTGTPPDGPPVTDRDDHTTDLPGGPPGPPPPPPLPATGTDAPTQLALAALALLLGAGLLLAARRTPSFDSWTTTAAFAGGLTGADSPPPVHRPRGSGFSSTG